MSTNDAEQPSAVIEMLATIEALVLTRPDKAFVWGMSPRGDQISKDLVIFPGDGSKDIELLEARMAEPTHDGGGATRGIGRQLPHQGAFHDCA